MFLRQDVKPAPTPMDVEQLLPYDGKASLQEIYMYQQKVSSFLYNYAATITRGDVAFTATKLSEFLQNPSPPHQWAVNCALSCLNRTKTFCDWVSKTWWKIRSNGRYYEQGTGYIIVRRLPALVPAAILKKLENLIVGTLASLVRFLLDAFPSTWHHTLLGGSEQIVPTIIFTMFRIASELGQEVDGQDFHKAWFIQNTGTKPATMTQQYSLVE